LQQILDTSTSFIQTANDNFDVTSALIRDANTVLDGQVATQSAIRSFARDLALFSGTLAGNDKALRKLLVNGAAGAAEVKAFLDENKVDLTELLSESVTTGEIVLKKLPGLKTVLVIYPYVVEGGFSVVAKDSGTGLYDAHFGLVLTPAQLCYEGYEGTVKRAPQDGSNKDMNTDARCTEAASKSNARGLQNLKRAAPLGDAPVVASYDESTGELSWGDPADAGANGDTTTATTGSVAPQTLGKDTWKWLFLQPLAAP
ncbi:MAG: MCE family protein, partial [Nocardioidaceae bacterium]